MPIDQQLADLDRALTDAERPQMAIYCIQKLTPDAARLFCQLSGIDYSSYAQLLQTHRTVAQLQSVIDRAQHEGPAVVFARAALAVRDAAVAKSVITTPDTSFEQVSIESPFVPDTRSGEEKLRAAKELVNGRTLRVVRRPGLEENRDELSAERLCRLRSVPRKALQR